MEYSTACWYREMVVATHGGVPGGGGTVSRAEVRMVVSPFRSIFPQDLSMICYWVGVVAGRQGRVMGSDIIGQKHLS